MFRPSTAGLILSLAKERPTAHDEAARTMRMGVRGEGQTMRAHDMITLTRVML